MKFGSVCSGIEAASVAWHPLGWRAAWLAEIEPFPSAVLAHHYPDVTNIGDMKKLLDLIPSGAVEAPDVFCGGTPCQAFSVAGLRKSLDDARGNLSLIFCEIANAIDSARHVRGEEPAIIFWENVPGVLSTKDNAFGCFLAGLAGEDDPLVAPGGKWTNAGCVHGPQRTVAWRVLDAQYFGVAQRRRRVFVVASARTGFDPTEVLFEFDGVRRDIAPRRQAGEGTTHPTAPCLTSGGRGVERTGDTRGQDPVVAVCPTLRAGGNRTGGDRPPGTDVDTADSLITVAFGGNNQSGPIDVATARNACASASGRMDFESETFLVQPCITGDITRTLKAEGFDASEDGTGRGTPMVPVLQYDHACVCGHGFFGAVDALCPSCGGGDGAIHGEAREVLQRQVPMIDGDFHCEACGEGNAQTWWPTCEWCGHEQTLAIAFSCKDNGRDCTEDLSPTLRAMGGVLPNGGGQMAVAFTTKLHNTTNNQAGKIYEEYTTSLDRSSPPPALLTPMQVRRLTPVECERLQGFPDNYTMIPWRKKPAEQCPDGPRYKALGNSWAVPNVRWIGQRIAAQLAKTDAEAEYSAPETGTNIANCQTD